MEAVRNSKTVTSIVKAGDVYAIHVAAGVYAVMQFAMRDDSQLSSDIVVVYRDRFNSINLIDCFEPTTQTVDFYTHTSVAVGVKAGTWTRVGNRPLPAGLSFMFRCTDDFGPAVEVSDKWYCWAPNQPYRDVGRLDSKTRCAEVGSIFGPPAVVERIRTGRLTHRFPE